MKTNLCLLALLATTVHAKLIDITPGGTDGDGGPPRYIAINDFYDEAAFGFFTTPIDPTPIFYQGWVSQFGILNGGQYFFTDLFTQPLSTTANVSWDFGNSGYFLQYIDVVGSEGIGFPLVANLYRVPYNSRLSSAGDVVTADGLQNIESISFYGRNPALPVPETGNTLVLLGLGLVLLLVIRQRRTV